MKIDGDPSGIGWGVLIQWILDLFKSLFSGWFGGQ